MWVYYGGGVLPPHSPLTGGRQLDKTKDAFFNIEACSIMTKTQCIYLHGELSAIFSLHGLRLPVWSEGAEALIRALGATLYLLRFCDLWEPELRSVAVTTIGTFVKMAKSDAPGTDVLRAANVITSGIFDSVRRSPWL